MNDDFFGSIVQYDDLSAGDFFVTHDGFYGFAAEYQEFEPAYAVLISSKFGESGPELIERNRLGVVLKLDAFIRPTLPLRLAPPNDRKSGTIIKTDMDAFLLCNDDRSIISASTKTGIIAPRNFPWSISFSAWEIVVPESELSEARVLFEYPPQKSVD